MIEVRVNDPGSFEKAMRIFKKAEAEDGKSRHQAERFPSGGKMAKSCIIRPLTKRSWR